MATEGELKKGRLPMHNIILTVVGLGGAVASIMALFKATDRRKVAAIHAIYLLSLCATVASYTSTKLSAERNLTEKNEELRLLLSPETQARSLLHKEEFRFSDQGFMLAVLTFLEKHKEQFPDTYRGAEAICEVNGLFESEEDGGLNTSFKQIDGRSAMKSLLEGISSGALREE